MRVAGVSRPLRPAEVSRGQTFASRGTSGWRPPKHTKGGQNAPFESLFGRTWEAKGDKEVFDLHHVIPAFNETGLEPSGSDRTTRLFRLPARFDERVGAEFEVCQM